MLYTTQRASQFSNPYVIKALTFTHGVYMNVYNKAESTEYDEGRDTYISNPYNYNVEPLYKKKKFLLFDPVQETFDSGESSFDSWLKDTYVLTCDKSLKFEKEQKFEVFYDKRSTKPNRVFQCFEVRELSNSYNQWSIRKIMLKPFN